MAQYATSSPASHVRWADRHLLESDHGAAVSTDRGDDGREVEERVAAHFEELNDAVFRYLAYGCRNPSDAEEITQETFLRLYRELVRQKTVVNVRYWVFKVARNLMLDRAKHLRRANRHVCEMPEDVKERVRCPRPTPEEAMIADARQTLVGAAMEHLTPVQRECFHLRSEGLRLRQIAEILHMDTRRVAEALNRAVATLNRILDVDRAFKDGGQTGAPSKPCGSSGER